MSLTRATSCSPAAACLPSPSSPSSVVEQLWCAASACGSRQRRGRHACTPLDAPVCGWQLSRNQIPAVLSALRLSCGSDIAPPACISTAAAGGQESARQAPTTLFADHALSSLDGSVNLRLTARVAVVWPRRSCGARLEHAPTRARGVGPQQRHVVPPLGVCQLQRQQLMEGLGPSSQRVTHGPWQSCQWPPLHR